MGPGSFKLEQTCEGLCYRGVVLHAAEIAPALSPVCPQQRQWVTYAVVFAFELSFSPGTRARKTLETEVEVEKANALITLSGSNCPVWNGTVRLRGGGLERVCPGTGLLAGDGLLSPQSCSEMVRARGRLQQPLLSHAGQYRSLPERSPAGYHRVVRRTSLSYLFTAPSDNGARLIRRI